MESNKKVPVLFLLMEFAPVNTTGNFRSLKFIKYLSQLGIQPIIVTFREDEGAKYLHSHVDPALLNDVPADAVVYRIHCDEQKLLLKGKLGQFLSIYFSIKDSLAERWRPYVLKEIDSIIKKHKPQMVYTSLPPFSSGMLAVEISKKFNLPLIVDMRDLWAMFGSSPLPTYLHFKLMVNEERKIFRQATAILGVTPQLLDTIKTTHPWLDAKKLHLIPNGFDRELGQPQAFHFTAGKQKIVIGYVGAFYFIPQQRDNVFKPWWKKRVHQMLEYNPVRQDWLYRSPYFFFKTLNLLFRKYPAWKQRVQIEFVGRKPEWLESMLNEFDLTGITVMHGLVDYKKSLALQKGFDLFLATAEKVIDGEHYCMPSKVFDYIGQGKPILGFVTPGIQKEFLEKSGLAVMCNPDDPDEAAETLLKLFTEGRTFMPDHQYLQQFNRFELAKKLAALIHQLNPEATVTSHEWRPEVVPGR